MLCLVGQLQLQDPRTHTPTVRILVEYCKRYQEGGLGGVSRSWGAAAGEKLEEVMKHIGLYIYI